MRYLSQEEYDTASRYLFLSMAIIIVEKDIRLVEEGPFKIKEPYLELLRKMEHRARLERRDLRRKMRDQQIEVIVLKKDKSFSTYLFMARGYEEERRYFNPAIRKKVEQILYELIRDVYSKRYHRAV